MSAFSRLDVCHSCRWFKSKNRLSTRWKTVYICLITKSRFNMITKVLNITDQNNSLSRPARILLMVQYTSKLRQKVKKDIGETIQNVCARQGNRLVVIEFSIFFLLIYLVTVLPNYIIFWRGKNGNFVNDTIYLFTSFDWNKFYKSVLIH